MVQNIALVNMDWVHPRIGHKAGGQVQHQKNVISSDVTAALSLKAAAKALDKASLGRNDGFRPAQARIRCDARSNLKTGG